MKPILSALAVCAAVAAVAASRPLAGGADDAGGAAAPAFDRKINLVYTVNNLGYTDTCG